MPGRVSRAERAARQEKVATLALAGVSIRETARLTGLSKGQVERALAELAAEWRQTAAQDMVALKGRQLQRFERIIASFWPKMRQGDATAAGVVMQAMAGLGKVAGLDAPVRLDITEHVREIALAYGLDPQAALAEAELILKELDR